MVMSALGEYIAELGGVPSRREAGTDPASTRREAGTPASISRRELNRIIERHEWFTTARRARALITGEPDPALILPLMFWGGTPPTDLATQDRLSEDMPPPTDSASAEATQSSELSAPPRTPETLSAMDPIDRFIEHGGYRIDPAGEAQEALTDIDIDPEMVSEELAEIYLAQGLTEEAEKIYSILKEGRKFV